MKQAAMDSFFLCVNESNSERVKEFREMVKDHAQCSYQLSDLYLLRWLESRHWDMERAADLYINSMKWRSETHPEEVSNLFPQEDPQLFQHFNSYWPCSITHQTKDGWPVIFLSIGRVDPEGLLTKSTKEWREKVFINLFETLEDRRKKCESQHGNAFTSGSFLILDLDGLGWNHFGSSALSFIKEAGAIGKLHYPEAVSKIFIMNAPLLFTTMWRSLKSTLSADTLKKITVCSSDPLSEIKPFVDLDQIPSNIGGTAPALPKGGAYFLPGEQQGVIEEHWETATVPRSGSWEKEIQIKERSLVVWEFKTEDMDLGFGVFCVADGQKTEELPVKRYECDKEVIRDLMEIKKPGKYLLHWDNTYSWVNRKFLLFRINILPSVPFKIEA